MNVTNIATDHPKLAQIRALLAKAESTEFPEERDALQAKAFALLAKYGIDEALAYAEDHRDETPTTVEIKIDNPYSHRKANLLAWIGNALGCKNITWNYGKQITHVVLYGFASDLERAEMLYTSLLLQATNQLVHITPPWHSNDTTLAYRNAWFQGFAITVAKRIQQAEQGARQDAVQADAGPVGTSVELVLVERKDRVQRYFEEANPKVKMRKYSKSRSRDGRNEGIAAGRQADIGQRRVDEPNRRAVGS